MKKLIERPTFYSLAKALKWSQQRLRYVLSRKQHPTIDDAVNIHLASHGYYKVEDMRPDAREFLNKLRRCLKR